MSTYTDLRNRVKENITVGYSANDRTTIQKVKFHNEENEYWGTFTGKMSVDNVTINSGALNDVSVYNSYIKNATLVNEDGIKINLSELGEQLDEISNDIIPGIKSDIDAISSAIISSQYIPAALSALDQRITDLSIAEDAKISSETEARISADFDISSYLNDKIQQEISDRISVDQLLSSESHEYVDENKHYHIKTVDSDIIMPFKATEFAVNVINGYDLPDAFAKNSETGELVGKVERYVISSRNCEFVPYTNADSKYTEILGTGSYVFTEGRTSCDCKDPTYCLTYVRNSESGIVTNQKFVLGPVDSTNPSYDLECVTEYSYTENNYKVDDIVIQIPNKVEGSSISREFLFVIKPYKTGVKANVRFVGEDGKDIKWFSNKEQKLEILTDTFITFRLQEVRDNKFMVIDWNLNKQEQEIDDLYGKLSNLSSDTAAKLALHDQQISDMSSEISALISSDNRNISMMGELTANGYTALSSFLINQDAFGGSGMVKVYPNWMYRMNGSSANPMVDNDGISNYIGDNDYVMFKNEKTIANVVFSDINFIRDSKAETEKIAGDLCAWTDANFVHLSGGNAISGHNEFVGKVKAYQLEAPNATVTELSSTNATITTVIADTIKAKSLSISSDISAELAQVTVQKIIGETATISTLSVPVLADFKYLKAASADITGISSDSSSIYLTDINQTLKTKIDGIDANIETNRANIVVLSTQVSTNKTNIDSLSTSIDTNKTNIDSLSTSIDTNKTNIYSLSTQVDTNKTNIDSLSISIDTNKTNIDILSAQVSADKMNIVALSANVITNETNIAALSTRYENTFLSSDHEECAELSADNLLLFDEKAYEGEEHHRKYRMVLSAGTIVLKRINA